MSVAQTGGGSASGCRRLGQTQSSISEIGKFKVPFILNINIPKFGAIGNIKNVGMGIGDTWSEGAKIPKGC